MKRILAAACLTALMNGPALATTGSGCLYVVNIAPGDALNMRARPAASARVVDRLVPGQHGILHLHRACGPKNLPWGQRWCRVTHYNGDRTIKGFVKARFVRDSECP